MIDYVNNRMKDNSEKRCKNNKNKPSAKVLVARLTVECHKFIFTNVLTMSLSVLRKYPAVCSVWAKKLIYVNGDYHNYIYCPHYITEHTERFRYGRVRQPGLR